METNVTRLLAQKRIPHDVLTYPVDEDDLSAQYVAQKIGLELDRVFKTLVALGGDGTHIVFVIPGSCELNLKKAAKAAGQKSIAMLPLKELEPVTGYVRGGCSPIGMKKQLSTYIDETALVWDTLSVSAGKRGVQVLLAPAQLADLVGAVFADLI
ncbi:MAG TPA: Cys-tRNA(Pro) deacylase [Spirochaetia bacterium]|nr:Cys-tRNA(Pro) deacylase [Spirochaetia bacterium]